MLTWQVKYQLQLKTCRTSHYIKSAELFRAASCRYPQNMGCYGLLAALNTWSLPIAQDVFENQYQLNHNHCIKKVLDKGWNEFLIHEYY